MGHHPLHPLHYGPYETSTSVRKVLNIDFNYMEYLAKLESGFHVVWQSYNCTGQKLLVLHIWFIMNSNLNIVPTQHCAK